MHFPLALHVVLLSATVTFALAENEKPQGLNFHRATSWTSSLRSLFQVASDTRSNEEYHHDESQPSFSSRIYRRRRRHNRRFHP